MPPTTTLHLNLSRPSLHITTHSTKSTSHRLFSNTPSCKARLIRRPHRPYTFTQLITLSDGSTFTHRTTSPLAVYKSSKDVRNTPLWNPSNAKMANVEEDEAGRLRAFRRRFGRGWDAQAEGEEAVIEGGVGVKSLGSGEGIGEEVKVVDGVGARVEAAKTGLGGESNEEKEKESSQNEWTDEAEDNLMDLIGRFGMDAPAPAAARTAKELPKGGKKGKR